MKRCPCPDCQERRKHEDEQFVEAVVIARREFTLPKGYAIGQYASPFGPPHGFIVISCTECDFVQKVLHECITESGEACAAHPIVKCPLPIPLDIHGLHGPTRR